MELSRNRLLGTARIAIFSRIYEDGSKAIPIHPVTAPRRRLICTEPVHGPRQTLGQRSSATKEREEEIQFSSRQGNSATNHEQRQHRGKRRSCTDKTTKEGKPPVLGPGGPWPRRQKPPTFQRTVAGWKIWAETAIAFSCLNIWSKAENHYLGKEQTEADITKATLQLRLGAASTFTNSRPFIKQHGVRHHGTAIITNELAKQHPGTSNNFFNKPARKLSTSMNTSLPRHKHSHSRELTKDGSSNTETARKLWHSGVWALSFHNDQAKDKPELQANVVVLLPSLHLCLPACSQWSSKHLATRSTAAGLQGLEKRYHPHPAKQLAHQQKRSKNHKTDGAYTAVRSCHTGRQRKAGHPRQWPLWHKHTRHQQQSQGDKASQDKRAFHQIQGATESTTPRTSSNQYTNPGRWTLPKEETVSWAVLNPPNPPPKKATTSGNGPPPHCKVEFPGKSRKNLASKRTSHMQFRHRHPTSTEPSWSQLPMAKLRSCQFCWFLPEAMWDITKRQASLLSKKNEWSKSRRTTPVNPLSKKDTPEAWLSQKMLGKDDYDLAIGGEQLCRFRPGSWLAACRTPPAFVCFRACGVGWGG